MGEWKLVGRITRNDMRGKDPVSKLHKKLKALSPKATEIAQFGMSSEAIEYFRQQLKAMAEKQGFNKKAVELALGMAMLQYAPAEIKGVTGFQVYVRQ
jgi:hypothetical protein